jgi:DNA polymerase III epsilon subunit-like protein
MNTEKISKLHHLTLDILRNAATIAKSVQEFRDELTRRAQQGDLDFIYNKVALTNKKREDFIKGG